MPDIASVTNVVQIGVETTPGTSVAANKLLQSLSVEPSPQTDVKTFRPMGSKFSVLGALGKEWIQAKLSGQATYSEIIYPLASCFSYATPTRNITNGSSYTWTFAPSQSALDTVKTYTVEHGNSLRARKWVYGIVNEFGYKISRDAFELDGNMIGQSLQDNITLTASPTAIELVPILPGQVSIFLDSSSANIGTTRLLRVLSFEFKMGDRFKPIWAINSNIASFSAHVEAAPKTEAKILLEADAQGMALLASLRTGTKQYLRVAAQGAPIETGYNYLFQHDMCVLVTKINSLKDQDGVYAAEFSLEVSFDPTWGTGTAQTIKVVNKQADV